MDTSIHAYLKVLCINTVTAYNIVGVRECALGCLRVYTHCYVIDNVSCKIISLKPVHLCILILQSIFFKSPSTTTFEPDEELDAAITRSDNNAARAAADTADAAAAAASLEPLEPAPPPAGFGTG